MRGVRGDSMSDGNVKLGGFQADDIVQSARSIQVALALIEQLRGGSALRLPYDNVKKIVDALLRDVPFVGYSLPELSVFRAFVGDSQLPANASRFSYKPLALGSSWGRCNRVGTTVFYGALNEDTVFSELGPEIGDTFYIGKARLKKDSSISLTCIGEIDHIRRYGLPLVGDEQAKQWLAGVMSQRPLESNVRTELVDAFFADMFSQTAFRAKDYKISSALSEILFEPGQLDGFAYPSVAHRGGLNVAIRPQAFDEKFEWEGFEALRVVDYLGFGLYARAPIARAVGAAPDGSLEWQAVEAPGTSPASTAAKSGPAT